MVKLLCNTLVCPREFNFARFMPCETSYMHFIYNKILLWKLQRHIPFPIKLKRSKGQQNHLSKNIFISSKSSYWNSLIKYHGTSSSRVGTIHAIWGQQFSSGPKTPNSSLLIIAYQTKERMLYSQWNKDKGRRRRERKVQFFNSENFSLFNYLCVRIQ